MSRASCRVVLIIAALGTCVTPADSQSRFPTFSGQWNLVTGAADPTMAARLLITQDDSRLTLTWVGTPINVRFDGAAVRNRGLRGGVIVSKASWVQNALVITFSSDTPIGSWEDLLVCSLDADGRLNLISITTPKTASGTMSTRQYIYAKVG